MKFAVPFSRSNEVDALIKAGAGELYCGIAEEWWTKRYGDHDSISRRQGDANFRLREDLSEGILFAQQQGVDTYLAVNMRYTEPQLDYLTELCGWFEEMGGRGLQISDIGLMSRLSGTTRLKLSLSLLAVAANSKSLQFYKTLGISRVVLPRFLNISEMQVLLEKSGLEGEAMVMFDKCRYVDGYCRYLHGYGMQGCRRNLGNPPNEFPCAACRLSELENAGVAVGKVGGRGTPLEYRIRGLEILREISAMSDAMQRRKRYQEFTGSTCYCYYGEHQS